MKNLEQFYSFIIERENIRRRRRAGLPRDQWTGDKILQTYSFTNVQREFDRVSVGLMKIYNSEYHAPLKFGEPPIFDIRPHMITLLLNCCLYRYFGTIGMAEAIGWVTSWSDDQRSRIVKLADDRMLLGKECFTPAYIVPNAGSSAPKAEVVCEVARLLWHSLGGDLKNPADSEVSPLHCNGRLELLCYRLQKIWGFGPFMSKEVALDFVMASGWIPDDWETWTGVGPGGKRGAARIRYGELVRINEDEALDVIKSTWAERDAFWTFSDMPLRLCDIQFQCCEFDKYSRVSDGLGKKPKRRFNPTIDEVTSGRS